MSLQGLEIRVMSTRRLLTKMHATLSGSSEIEFVMDGCDSLVRRVRWLPIRNGNLNIIRELSGIDMLIDMINAWMKNMQIVVCALRALASIARYSRLEADRIIELDGVALAEQCREAHPNDRDCQRAAMRLHKILTQRSSSLAERELRLCRECATNKVDLCAAFQLGRLVNNNRRERIGAALAHAKRQKGKSVDMAALTKVCLGHMREHLWSRNVQDAGLDALLELARIPPKEKEQAQEHVIESIASALLEQDAADLIIKAMNKHRKAPEVQWKASLIIVFMSTQHDSLASDLGKRGAVLALKHCFDHYHSDREIRQQAIWALGALALKVKTNVERLQRDQIFLCVREAQRKNSSSEQDPQKLIAIPLNLKLLWSDKELEELATSAEKRRKKSAAATSELATESQRQMVFTALNPVSNQGKGKFNRVSADFNQGTSGLIGD